MKKKDRSPVSISVAMTTFNGSRYVVSQLESMVTQTLLPDEIVIGDDQSTDATESLVVEFTRRHPNISVRFERNINRLGTTANFERVVERCQGDLVIFADQDDLWMPTRLARVVETFMANPGAAYVFSNGSLINEKNHQIKGSLFSGVDFTRRERASYKKGNGLEVLLRHNVVTGAALAVRRAQLKRVLPFQPNWHHDYYLAIVLDAVAGGVLLDEPLIQYRCHHAQQVGVAGQGRASKVLAYARKQKESYCRQDAESFRAIRDRLTVLGVPPLHPVLVGLSEKSSFYDMRARMRAVPRDAPRLLWQAWHKGYYARYALGLKQVVVDVLSVVLATMQKDSER